MADNRPNDIRQSTTIGDAKTIYLWRLGRHGLIIFVIFPFFIIFVLILFVFYPRNLLLYEWVPADSWLCSSIQLIPFPFRLVTWSAVCHMTELSGGRVAGGLAGHVECSWSVQVLGQRMRGKAP